MATLKSYAKSSLSEIAIASLMTLAFTASGLCERFQPIVTVLLSVGIFLFSFWVLARFQRAGEFALIVPATMLAVASLILGNAHLLDISQRTSPPKIAIEDQTIAQPLADLPPKILATKLPFIDAESNLVMPWTASDDFGLTSVTAEINLSDEQADGMGFAGNGIFLYDPPTFEVRLLKNGITLIEDSSKLHFSGHPWSGLYVDLTLTAQDSQSQIASTDPVRFLLAEKALNRSLAQTLLDLRKKLILVPESAFEVAAQMSRSLAAATDLEGKSGLTLNLVSAKNRLNLASSQEDVVDVVHDLWPLILEVEGLK